MIREAVRDDIPVIRRMILLDVQKRSWEDQSGLEPDPFSIDTVLRYHILKEDSVVLVNEEDEVSGYLVGQLLPFVLDIRKWVAHEKMSGGQGTKELWDEFLSWGKSKGAEVMVVGCYDQLEGSRFRRI